MREQNKRLNEVKRSNAKRNWSSAVLCGHNAKLTQQCKAEQELDRLVQCENNAELDKAKRNGAANADMDEIELCGNVRICEYVNTRI